MRTASVINMVMERSGSPEPEVGMGGTVLMWTDRHAVTVVEVLAPGLRGRIRVQNDKAIRTDPYGMSDAQEYRYERNPEGHVSEYSRRANGAWVRVGESLRGGQRLVLGTRRHYHDYSF